MKSDGSEQVNLTNNPQDDGYATWSPDGNRIAFASFRDGNSEIYVMNADGSGQVTRLTNNPAQDVDPAWSFDSKKIVFASDRDGSGEIYVMNADGTGQTNLTQNSTDDWQPDWWEPGYRSRIYLPTVLKN